MCPAKNFGLQEENINISKLQEKTTIVFILLSLHETNIHKIKQRWNIKHKLYCDAISYKQRYGHHKLDPVVP